MDSNFQLLNKNQKVKTNKSVKEKSSMKLTNLL
jgi:hypothetical protein